MARVEITREALADFERLFDFLAEHDPRQARAHILSVRRALTLLADHPLPGQKVEEGRRELVLSRGRHGCIAKYRWLPAEEVVLRWRCGTSARRGFSKTGPGVPVIGPPGHSRYPCPLAEHSLRKAHARKQGI